MSHQDAWYNNVMLTFFYFQRQENACRADRVCPSTHVFKLENRITDFDKIWYGRYLVWDYPKIHSF